LSKGTRLFRLILPTAWSQDTPMISLPNYGMSPKLLRTEPEIGGRPFIMGFRYLFFSQSPSYLSQFFAVWISKFFPPPLSLEFLIVIARAAVAFPLRLVVLFRLPYPFLFLPDSLCLSGLASASPGPSISREWTSGNERRLPPRWRHSCVNFFRPSHYQRVAAPRTTEPLLLYSFRASFLKNHT